MLFISAFSSIIPPRATLIICKLGFALAKSQHIKPFVLGVSGVYAM